MNNKNFDFISFGPSSYVTIPALQKQGSLIHAFGTRTIPSDALKQALKIENTPFFPEQVHGDTVIVLEKGNGGASHPKIGDAVITHIPGFPVAIHTADCCPIILFDPSVPAAGIVHAGRVGTLKEITLKTVNVMDSRFHSDPAKMYAALGPSIRKCCYSVGSEIIEDIHATKPSYLRQIITHTKDEEFFLDLPLANRLQLQRAGLKEEHIIDSCLCTSCNNSRFFSYRKEGKSAGRQVSLVMIQ